MVTFPNKSYFEIPASLHCNLSGVVVHKIKSASAKKNSYCKKCLLY